MAVYLARFGLLGPVKIGSATNVATRLDQIGQRLWDDLRLLRYLDGTAADERRLHQRFIAQRIRLEWFHYHPDMLGDLGLPDLAGQPDATIQSLAPRFKLDRERAIISESIREWMIASGLCERSLAALLGCKATTVGEWLKYGSGIQKGAANKLIDMSNGVLSFAFAERAEIRRQERLAQKEKYAKLDAARLVEPA